MIVEQCDYHFFFLWAEERRELTMKEFRAFLKTFPNSDNALSIADRFIELGCGDNKVEELI